MDRCRLSGMTLVADNLDTILNYNTLVVIVNALTGKVVEGLGKVYLKLYYALLADTCGLHLLVGTLTLHSKIGQHGIGGRALSTTNI